MGTNLKTNGGKNIMLYRSNTENLDLSTTQFLAASRFRVGVDQTVPTESTTSLVAPIPLEDGTVCDNGANQLTGSNGGANSTDNTTTYKQGAGLTDNTSQNLITTGSNVLKTWTIADLASLGNDAVGTKPYGKWLYIIDATALAKIVQVEIKIGDDIAGGDYYSMTFANAVLSTGWNWLTSGEVNVEDLTETGTVAGDLDQFQIEVTTGAAGDAFIAGDLLYDLFRQWTYADTVGSFTVGFPSFDYTNNEVEIRCRISSIQANGFLINALVLVNQDTTVLISDILEFDGQSKSLSDEFIYILKGRLL